ncbi:MAG: DUF975 family protein [Faecalibacterium sp.]|jgi:uncharacterized membrane protein|nr:DUF975 family protein [Faecalibacterium sp.]
MWTRALLKTNAKQVLGRCYWRIFAACLIASLLGAGLGGSGVSFNYSLNNSAGGPSHSGYSSSMGGYTTGYTGGDSLPAEFWAAIGVTLVVVFLIALAIGLCWQIFLSNPVSVGLGRFLMESRVGRSPMDTLFSLFRKGNYMNTVKGMFWYRLKVFAWGLLLIVPGIVKGYEYRFVPFLLAENPHMDATRAQELSRLMTNGEKGSMFVLDLSFVGWYLLAGLSAWLLSLIPAFGALLGALGVLFGSLCILPYYSATIAELYAAMREKAFAMGVSNESELGGFIRY